MKDNDPIDLYNNLPMLGLLPICCGFLLGSLIVGRFDALIFSFLLIFGYSSKIRKTLDNKSFKKLFIAVIFLSTLTIVGMYFLNAAFVWLLLPILAYWGRRSYNELKGLEKSI